MSSNKMCVMQAFWIIKSKQNQINKPLCINNETSPYIQHMDPTPLPLFLFCLIKDHNKMFLLFGRKHRLSRPDSDGLSAP